MPLIIYRRFEKILLGEFQELGFEPNIFCINDDARTTILWARAGLGIGIVPKSAINFDFMDNIKYKDNKPRYFKNSNFSYLDKRKIFIYGCKEVFGILYIGMLLMTSRNI